jgi:hypothetical protein
MKLLCQHAWEEKEALIPIAFDLLVLEELEETKIL